MLTEVSNSITKFSLKATVKAARFAITYLKDTLVVSLFLSVTQCERKYFFKVPCHPLSSFVIPLQTPFPPINELLVRLLESNVQLLFFFFYFCGLVRVHPMLLGRF